MKRRSRTKQPTPRDGWSGETFRALREARGPDKTRAWLAVQTRVCVETVRAYEQDDHFPPHHWRDDAAEALRLKRSLLGLRGA